jgi:hypothetical protein
LRKFIDDFEGDGTLGSKAGRTARDKADVKVKVIVVNQIA